MSEKSTKNVGRKSSYVLFERKMTRKMLSLVLIAIGAVFLLRELIRGRFGDAVVAFLTGVFRLDYSDALYIYEAIFRQNLDSIIDIVYIGGLFYSASIFFPLILALYWKKATNANAAFWSMIAAFAMGAFSQFYLSVHYTSGILSLPANVMGSTVGLIVFVAITLLSKNETKTMNSR